MPSSQMETEVSVIDSIINTTIDDFQEKDEEKSSNEFGQFDGKDEQKPIKKSLEPAFDFRGKQQPNAKQMKEKVELVEIKTSESSGFGKPKFDFRNKKL